MEGFCESPVVAKIGGGAVTDKSHDQTLRPDALNRVVQFVRSCVDVTNSVPVLVSGAGSFGHVLASRTGLDCRPSSRPSSNERRVAASVVRSQAQRLASLIASHLCNADIPCIVFSPIWSLEGTTIKWDTSSLDSIRSLVASGVVPLLHGDVVFPLNADPWILSGDIIAPSLALHLSSPRLIFLSLHALHSRDPSDPSSSLVTVLEPSRFRQNDEWHPREELVAGPASTGADTTGGMAAKIHQALQLSAQGRCAVHLIPIDSDFSKTILKDPGMATSHHTLIRHDTNV